MSLDFPLLVRSRNFCFFCPGAGKGAVSFATFPEKGILDFIAHRPIIQVSTVHHILLHVHMAYKPHPPPSCSQTNPGTQVPYQ